MGARLFLSLRSCARPAESCLEAYSSFLLLATGQSLCDADRRVGQGAVAPLLRRSIPFCRPRQAAPRRSILDHISSNPIAPSQDRLAWLPGHPGGEANAFPHAALMPHKIRLPIVQASFSYWLPQVYHLVRV